MRRCPEALSGAPTPRRTQSCRSPRWPKSWGRSYLLRCKRSSQQDQSCVCDLRLGLGRPQPGVHRCVRWQMGDVRASAFPSKSFRPSLAPDQSPGLPPPRPRPNSCRRKAGSDKASSNRAPWHPAVRPSLPGTHILTQMGRSPKASFCGASSDPQSSQWDPGPCLQWHHDLQEPMSTERSVNGSWRG